MADSAHALLDALPEPLLWLQPDGRLLHANRAAVAWLRRDAGALRAATLHSLLEADEGDIQDLLRLGWRASGFSPARMRWRLGDDSVEDCRLEVTHVAAGEGGSAGVLLRLLPGAAASGRFLALGRRVDALSREVARRRRAEAALQAQSEWLQVVLRSIGDAVIATDLHGRVVFMNPVAERLCACLASQAGGCGIEQVMPLRHDGGEPLGMHPVRRALAERRRVGLEKDSWLEPSGGARVPVDDAAGPIVDAAGRVMGAVIVFREISDRVHAEAERRALEHRLRAAQKMEAIGTLAGGIAHDFNNVLGAILGNAGLAREEIDPAHPVAPRLAQIDRAGRRARELVRQIMAFSRRQPQKLERVDLRALAHDCLALLRGTLPSSVELRIAGDDGEPLTVVGDASQIEQVLMNLCTNAWQALEDGSGRIDISVGVAGGAPPPGLQPGFANWDGEPRAQLSVQDDGTGMEGAVVQRLFEPFFTTRGHSGGTGLGLSVVHGIVAEHRGQIAIRSMPGRGSCFDIFLPLVDRSPTPVALPTNARAPRVRGAGRHVLVVDDDELMRMTLDAVLRRDGFEVRSCPGAQAALSMLEAVSGEFELLVTDHNMPGMTGMALAAEVRRLHPGLPVILTSGYLSEDLHRGAVALGNMKLLNKEDSFDKLSALIDTMLRER